jgi:hypothetical protein
MLEEKDQRFIEQPREKLEKNIEKVQYNLIHGKKKEQKQNV